MLHDVSATSGRTCRPPVARRERLPALAGEDECWDFRGDLRKGGRDVNPPSLTRSSGCRYQSGRDAFEPSHAAVGFIEPDDAAAEGTARVSLPARDSGKLPSPCSWCRLLHAGLQNAATGRLSPDIPGAARSWLPVASRRAAGPRHVRRKSDAEWHELETTWNRRDCGPKGAGCRACGKVVKDGGSRNGAACPARRSWAWP